MASIIPCQSTSAAAVFRRGAAHHCAFPTCRTLSSSARHNAALTNQAQLKGKSQPQMSMNSRMKELLKSANRDLIPEDMGLLPGTFIRPVWQNMPSLFKEPQLRLHMEWLYWKMKVQNFLGLLIYCKYLNKKVPLRLRERTKTALNLHKQMYTAFASGNLPALSRTCCDGLYHSFASRISRRPRNVPNPIWTLHSYSAFPRALTPTISGARIVSDRAAGLPGAGAGFGIRQVVVRIRSQQSLTRPAKQTQEAASKQKGGEQAIVANEVKKQDCTEYVVIQRVMFNKEEGPWKVWGLAEETTPKDIQTDASFAPSLSMKDRISAMTGGKI